MDVIESTANHGPLKEMKIYENNINLLNIANTSKYSLYSSFKQVMCKHPPSKKIKSLKRCESSDLVCIFVVLCTYNF